jgi:hypothetical protein
VAKYKQGTVKPERYAKIASIMDRIQAAFLDNLGHILSRGQLLEVARDPRTGEEPENWHQRLSELRTDRGYSILSKRDDPDLKVGEYVMLTATRRSTAGRRIRPTPAAWAAALARAGNSCEWEEDGSRCSLQDGHTDPIGWGTVRLTPDHRRPHADSAASDPEDPECWGVLCPRHQVMKKNYWDDTTGKINVMAIIQAAPRKVKQQVYAFLKRYFGDDV